MKTFLENLQKEHIVCLFSQVQFQISEFVTKHQSMSEVWWVSSYYSRHAGISYWKKFSSKRTLLKLLQLN